MCPPPDDPDDDPPDDPGDDRPSSDGPPDDGLPGDPPPGDPPADDFGTSRGFDGGPRVPSFSEYLERGRAVLDHHPSLAVVPLLAAFLHVDNVRKVLAEPDVHFGVTFRLPTSIATFWTFASVPTLDSGFYVSPTLWLAPLFVVVESALAAGYLGSIHDAVETGRYEFGRNTKRYFPRFAGYTLLLWLALALAVPVALVSPALVLLLVPVWLVLAYFFYATPYLFVAADLGVVDALRRSYELSQETDSYGRFALRYLLFVAAASIVGTLFVNLKLVGVVLGAVLAAPLALTLNAATMAFVTDLVERQDGQSEGFERDESDW